MGLLDKAKAKAAEAVDKHGDKIDRGLDKAGEMADKRTQGQHTDKIADARAKASDALDKVDSDKKDDLPPRTPPASPPDSDTPPPVR